MSEDKRIEELENRVKKLEEKVINLNTKLLLDGSPSPSQEVKKTMPVVRESIHEQKEQANVPLSSVVATSKKEAESSSYSSKLDEKKEKVDYEKLIGQVWLPRIFIFVLILGVLWGFKAAGDSGFITAPVKVIIGYIVAGVFLFFGNRQLRKERQALGQVLLGGSVVILILSTFAAHILYHLLGPTVSFVLNVVWVLLGIYLSGKENSQPIAIISAIAGFLVPFLVESQHPNTYVFVGYEVLFFILLLQFSLFKKYLYLYFVSGALLHFAMIVTYFFSQQHGELLATGILVQHVFLLLAFMKKELYFNAQRATLFTSFVLTQLWIKAIFEINGYSVFLFSGFALYGILSFVYYKRDNVKFHVTLPLATYALAMFILISTTDKHLGLALLFEGLLAVYVGLYSKSKTQTFVGSIVYVASIFMIAKDFIPKINSYETVAWLFLIASLFLVRFILKRLMNLSINKVKRETITDLQISNLGYEQLLHFLFVVISGFIALFIAQVTDNAYTGVTLLVQGLLTLYIAVKASKKFESTIAIIVYLIGFVFTYFYNGIEKALSVDTFAWLFLILSLVFIKKIYVNSEKQNTEAFNYPSIQNWLFWTLVLTILYVITRLGSVVTEHLSTNIHSLTITSIWAIYAIASVVYGVVAKNKKVRLVGIGLLFLTLLKLIIVDMTSVSIVVRAILFIGVGFIGVAISRFFYSNKKGD